MGKLMQDPSKPIWFNKEKKKPTKNIVSKPAK
jgi:hypothetical protein